MQVLRIVVALLCSGGCVFAASGDALRYRKPAANWNEALPVGNGRLGAMVFGGVEHEHIQLNEGTVWAGGRRDRNNPAGYTGFVEARRLLLAGKTAEAQVIADRDMIGVPHRMPQYQTLGDLTIDFSGQGTIANYERTLDLDRAVATVIYRLGEATCRREVLSSAVDQVIAIRVTCDKPGLLTFSATLSRPADSTTDSVAGDSVRLRGEAIPRDERHADEPKVGVKFTAMLRVIAQGGTTKSEHGRVSVEGATRATLLIAAETNFREKDPDAACLRDLKAAAKPWEAIREAHIRDYRRFFDRFSINLGDGDGAPAALYLQFARYLLISGSRPGNLPETLQGLWNDSLAPPWDSKYTININTEMNYWPAEECNLSDLTTPLFDLIDIARGPGRITAQKLYHASGFVIHHNTDIWGDAVPIDQARSGMWPMGGAWLSLHLWDHYDYTGDRAFLARRGYPVMKEAAQFLLDYLTDDGHGHLVTGPSVSPENRFKLPDGKQGFLVMGPYMDTEITRALFTRVIESSQILGVDPEFRQSLIAARSRLMPFKIGKYGQLQEWPEDYDESEPGHRHISHLFALFPDSQITPRITPDLARAARASLERRLSHGGGSTGWSRAWIVSYWARLLDGEQAWKHFRLLQGKSTLPNMFNDGPPFQIDGNFGGAAGLIEMILQSHSGEIAFLPAIPAAWPEGSVKGLRARGAVEIDMAWHKGKAESVMLRPATSARRKLRAPTGQTIQAVSTDGHAVALSPTPDGAVDIELVSGKSYKVVFQ